MSHFTKLISLMLMTSVAYADTDNGDSDAVQHYFSQSSSYQNVANSAESAPYSASQTEPYLLQRSQMIQHYLASKQYENLASFIHPTKGVRFSMYAYVDPETDKIFSRDQFNKYLAQSRIKFTWGKLGESERLYTDTLPNYLNNWVKAEDFGTHIDGISFNHFEGLRNRLYDSTGVYANAYFVGFYHEGTEPKYEGLDWRSLRLVFEQYGKDYYLVGIITDSHL